LPCATLPAWRTRSDRLPDRRHSLPKGIFSRFQTVWSFGPRYRSNPNVIASIFVLQVVPKSLSQTLKTQP
jgi:hypothetical protein